MENSSINSDLIRGHINTIILCALADGDKYGYEICKIIEIKSNSQYILKQPTLYSSLKRLETLGYINSYWGSVSNGGRRKYYQLTELGREFSNQNQSEWEYSRTVIDKLISEKDFDFNNSPPSENVDFNLLKQTVTRINTSNKNIEEPEKENIDIKNEDKNDLLENKIDIKEEKIIEETDKTLIEVKSENKEAVKNLAELFPEKIEKPAELNYKELISKLYPQKKVIEEKVEIKNEKTSPLKEEKIINIEKTNDENFQLLPHRQQGKIDFSDIYDKATNDGIKFRANSTSVKQKTTIHFLLKNKLLLHTILIIYCIMIIELAITFFAFNKILDFNYIYYLLMFGLMTLLPFLMLIVYLVNPNRKVNSKFNFRSQIINSLIVFMSLVLIIIAISLISGVSLINMKELLLKIILPIVLVLNIPLSVIIYGIIIRYERYYK